MLCREAEGSSGPLMLAVGIQFNMLFFFLTVLWLVGSSFPDQGWNLAQGSESVESTGPPGNSLNMLLSAGYI